MTIVKKEPQDMTLVKLMAVFHTEERCREMLEAVLAFRTSQATGGVTIRRTTDPACSFAKVQNGWVVETREKDPFTDLSTTGPYWWRHGIDFVTAATASCRDGIHSVSPTYNWHLQQQHGKVLPFFVLSFKHVGTPEDYEAYRRYLDLQRRPTPA